MMQAWRDGVQRARRHRAGDDPEPVLASLGLALVLHALGETIPRKDRDVLRAAGRRALLAAGDGSGDDDLRWARSIGKAGLDVLEGRGAAVASIADPLHPPAGRLVDMLRGRPGGLSAGACAAHLLGCERCAGALRIIHEQGSHRLAVAASGAAPMRAPSEGRVVLRREDPEVEAVLFDARAERSLAIYTADPEPVRLEAGGVTTEQMLGGYWLGRLDEGVSRLEGTLFVGDVSISLTLELGHRTG